MSKGELIESLEVREYKPGEIIVREGEPHDRFFAILKGEVQITQLDKSIRILTERDVFGLENYYRGVPYTTTAKATSPRASRRTSRS
jgi:CRP-like cAMP-binding protein